MAKFATIKPPIHRPAAKPKTTDASSTKPPVARTSNAAIEAMVATGNADLLALSRLKKRKLQLKDEITEINNGLLPDIIA